MQSRYEDMNDAEIRVKCEKRIWDDGIGANHCKGLLMPQFIIPKGFDLQEQENSLGLCFQEVF